MVSSGLGFGRRSKLLSPAQFESALRARPLARGSFFTFHRCTQPSSDAEGADLPKLGLVIPKRLVRLSVRRNAIKRVLREAFRHQQTSLRPGYYVFRVKAPVNLANLRDLKRIVRAEADQLIGDVISKS